MNKIYCCEDARLRLTHDEGPKLRAKEFKTHIKRN
ncbi:hypothetical protein SUSAZ_06270 [Sulfolobus acidocaldarius SUSAZ]|nr:hypothetical protein SUSAZ_06270 [Sulfolobus acidocaldarius SUSAZ]